MSSLLFTLKSVFSGDFLVLFLITLFFFGIAFFLGRGRMSSILFAFYPSMLLYANFPYVNKMLVATGDKMIVLNKLGIFLLFLLPISYAIGKHTTDSFESNGVMKLLKTFGLALAGTGLTLVLSYGLVNFESLYDFGERIDSLFTNSEHVFYWNIGILVLLAFL